MCVCVSVCAYECVCECECECVRVSVCVCVCILIYYEYWVVYGGCVGGEREIERVVERHFHNIPLPGHA